MGMRGVIALVLLVAGLAAANLYRHRRVAEQIRVGQSAVRRDIEELAAFHAELLHAHVALAAFQAGRDPGGAKLQQRLSALDERGALLHLLTPHAADEAATISKVVAAVTAWGGAVRARISAEHTDVDRADLSAHFSAVSQSFTTLLDLHQRLGGQADQEISNLQRRQESLAIGISVIQALTIGLALALQRRRVRLEAHVRATEHASAELRRMAASVAHEVNNQLGVLQNTVSLLRRTNASEQLLPIQEQGIEQIRMLVRDLLEFSNPVLALTDSVNVAEVASEVAQEFPDVAVSSEGTVFVRGDRRALSRALLNVIKNAVEAGGPVELRVSSDGTSATLLCHDRGAGISPEHQDDVGRPFFTTKARGTGLGLALARQVIEGHGGALVLRNAEVGAVAEIRLPVAAAPPASSEALAHG